MDSKRDGNNTIVGWGVASETVIVDGVQYIAGVTPVPITVNSVTGRLRCKAAENSGANASPDRQQARLDGNGEKTMVAETNDASRTITPLTVNTVGLMVQAT